MNGLKLIRSGTRSLGTAAALALAAALAACTGGAPTTTNPVTSVPTGQSYTGPAPSTADVQAFEVNLWVNINPSNRCGGCHHQNGQSPMFARTDDVNLAYQAANTVVNLSQPSQSTMVQKVAGGHNCWLASPQACADTITQWIQNWAGTTANSQGTQIQLVAPPSVTVGASKSFPPASTGAGLYQSTVYPIVHQWCSKCHSDTAGSAQQPYFASNDVIDIAYPAAQPKIVLADANPGNATPAVACTVTGSGMNGSTTCLSRFVQRLVQDHHNCWSDCTQDGQQMLSAIIAMANQIPLTPIDPSLVVSKALTLYDGTIASGQGRYQDDQIALYEFKTGTGNIAYDTSGVEPEADLTLSGNVTWVNGWGITIGQGGKAQGTTTASSKLNDLITSTGEFSIEAWVNPNNQAQANAWIVSYSGGPTTRNFTLAQNAFSYEGLVRSSVTDVNGMPALVTDPNNEAAQAALQHVVLTYDPVNGRKLFVNGVFTGDVDTKGGGTLANWDNTFALVLGSETSGSNGWQGEIQLVAVHNRALTPAQILQNFNAGVGEKYFLLFDVSALTNMAQSYIMLTAQLNDNYSYLFTNPTFISLDPKATPPSIPIQGIRIGINGAEAPVGQSYIPLSTAVSPSVYNAQSGQQLVNGGAVIQLENGPASDQFFLSFAQIGTHTHTYTDPVVTAPAPTPGAPVTDLGVATFERINQSMAKMTGVSPQNAAVSATYQSVQQSLPSIPDLDAYAASNQTALAQLAATYCSALVTDSSLSKTFFGASFDATQPGSWVSANQTLVINALYNNLVGTNGGTALTSQPAQAAVSTELGNLIGTLAAGPAGSAAGGAGTIATAACSALMSSATTVLN
ncbi:MAG TPA: LamG domain-containing protein [Steroidobacteraceae bacterium]|nr:LamG domain-containing protein [Steroidobacteraceae bacterium]